MLLRKHVPIPYLLGHVKWEFVFVSIYAFGIVYVDEILHIRDLSIPIEIPSILATTISLILAFRTGQSYDRWWEGRTLWGAIVNDSRTLTRQVLNFCRDSTEKTRMIQQQIAYNQIAWCHVLGDTLRGQELSASKGISNLDPDVLNEGNVPNAILKHQSKLLTQLRDDAVIDSFEFVQMDETLRRLTDAMGGVERINNTVFPRQYSMYVDIFLYFFIIMLPFGIVNYFGLFEGPLMVLVSMSFIILERNAELMQDPFRNRPSDVPVTSIAVTIERNIRQMLGEALPPREESNKYFVL